MPEPLVFRFDFVSPYSYIASEKIDAIAERFGRKVIWKPILLGAIFKHLGTLPLTRQPGLHDYSTNDFARSARFHNLPLNMPAGFPASSVAASRAYYWLHGRDCALARRFAHGIFRCYFVDGRDIADPPVILDVAAGLGIAAADLTAGMENPEIKNKLREETEAAIALGVFGAPWVTVDGEHFWGADRLPQVERWLERGGF